MKSLRGQTLSAVKEASEENARALVLVLWYGMKGQSRRRRCSFSFLTKSVLELHPYHPDHVEFGWSYKVGIPARASRAECRTALLLRTAELVYLTEAPGDDDGSANLACAPAQLKTTKLHEKYSMAQMFLARLHR